MSPTVVNAICALWVIAMALIGVRAAIVGVKKGKR